MPRNCPTVSIQGYSPEEYAAQWGGDPAYMRRPNLPGDGYLFYNFSSETNRRTAAWLSDFAAAIGRTIKAVELRPETHSPDDAANLRRLLAHVLSLKPE